MAQKNMGGVNIIYVVGFNHFIILAIILLVFPKSTYSEIVKGFATFVFNFDSSN